MAVPEDPVRYTDAVLVDDEQRLHRGDVLLHPDGRWSTSRATRTWWKPSTVVTG